MTNITPYLLFDGNCSEAMSFYKSCFGGDLSIMTVQDSPARHQMPKGLHNKIIYARLKSETVDISASDWLRPDRTPGQGNTICLYISGGTFVELKDYFDKLSVGASVVDPLAIQLFGTYGALTDRYGVRWMFQGSKE